MHILRRMVQYTFSAIVRAAQCDVFERFRVAGNHFDPLATILGDYIDPQRLGASRRFHWCVDALDVWRFLQHLDQIAKVYQITA